MKIVPSLTVMAALLLIPAAVWAASSEADIRDEAFDGLSAEFSTCAGYFAIASHTLEAAAKKGLAERYGKAMETAKGYALSTAQVSRTPEAANKVSSDRFEAAMDQMSRELAGNINNMTRLTDKYGLRCMKVVEKPEAAVAEWMEKTAKKYDQGGKTTSAEQGRR